MGHLLKNFSLRIISLERWPIKRQINFSGQGGIKKYLSMRY
jgi:hypothetical protein